MEVRFSLLTPERQLPLAVEGGKGDHSLQAELSGHQTTICKAALFPDENRCVLKSEEKYMLVNPQNYRVPAMTIHTGELYPLSDPGGVVRCALFVDSIGAEAESFRSFEICGDRIVLHIGRSPENEIAYQSPYVSRHHGDLILCRESCLILDKGSENGVYLNGERIQTGVETPVPDRKGIICIMGLRISVTFPIVYIGNPNGAVTVRHQDLREISFREHEV